MKTLEILEIIYYKNSFILQDIPKLKLTKEVIKSTLKANETCGMYELRLTALTKIIHYHTLFLCVQQTQTHLQKYTFKNSQWVNINV